MTTTQYFLILPVLALVLALAVLSGLAARRFGLAARGQGGGRLETVHSLALDARRRVHLLRCDGRNLLLLTGGSSDQFLGWVDERPPAPAEPTP